MVGAKQQKAAVARVMAGAVAKVEAERLGVSGPTMTRWVEKWGGDREVKEEAARLKGAKPPEVKESAAAVPKMGGADDGLTPLERARKGAGLVEDASLPPGGAGAVMVDDDRRYVVETVQSLKETAVGLLAARYKIPDKEPELAKLKQLGPLLKSALEAHAPWLAPMLREKVGSGRWMLYAAVLLEAMALLRATSELAKKHHPELYDAKKPEAPPPPEPAKERPLSAWRDGRVEGPLVDAPPKRSPSVPADELAAMRSRAVTA